LVTDNTRVVNAKLPWHRYLICLQNNLSS